MWVARWILVLIVFIIALWFGFQNNSQIVTVKFWKYQASDVPLVMALFVAYVLGALTWFIIAIVQYLQIKAEMISVRRDKAKLEKELSNLRNMSIVEEDTKLGEENDSDN